MRRVLDRFFPRNACPVCGSRHHHLRVDEFVVCDGCSEMLEEAELVRRKTSRTRTRYMVANHIPSD